MFQSRCFDNFCGIALRPKLQKKKKEKVKKLEIITNE